MKFKIIEDGLGLEITAETGKEVMELLKHLYSFGDSLSEKVLKYARNIAEGSLTLAQRVTGRRKEEGARWFAHEYTAEPKWLQPYMDRLKRDTGYDGPIPTIEPGPRYTGYVTNLCHTRIIERSRISPDGYTAWGYDEAGPWNGKTAEQYSASKFAEYVCEDIGDRRHEPEYIPVSGHGGAGLLKHNPNYLKRHYPHPAAKNHVVYNALLQWWLDNAATPGQRDVVQRALACHRTVCKNDTLGEWLLRSYANGWRVAWDGKGSFIEQEDFLKM